MFSGYSLHRKDFKGQAARAFVLALAAAEYAVEEHEQIDRDLACHLAAATLFADLLVGDGIGDRMLTKAIESYPQEPVLRLAQIRRLLNQGRRPEATTVAQMVSDKEPTETFAAAEEIVQGLLATVG